MPSWTPRTPPSSAWSPTRLWGAYLKTKDWEYVTDVLGRRIVVLVRWGSLSTTAWTARTIPS